jgi:hypothetical protein
MPEAVRAVGGEVLRQDVRDARPLHADDLGHVDVTCSDGVTTAAGLVP